MSVWKKNKSKQGLGGNVLLEEELLGSLVVNSSFSMADILYIGNKPFCKSPHKFLFMTL